MQKEGKHGPLQGAGQFEAPEGQSAAFENLPKLDGITYQIVTARDGRECIIATGNTHARKEVLTGAGFKWNPERKVWWMYADVA